MVKEVLKKNKAKFISILAIFLLLIFSLPFSRFINIGLNKLFLNANILSKNDSLCVHFIDVGEGDAIAINFANGEVALIDMGTQFFRSNLLNYLDNNVMNNKTNNKIEYLFYTHADADHIGGLSVILNKFEVKNIYRSRQYLESENSADEYGGVVSGEIAVEAIETVIAEKEQGANLQVAYDGMKIDISGATFEIFYPLETFEDKNDFSYFIKISYNGKSLLVGGDASQLVESKLIETHAEDLDCDVLKVSHHGSDDATSSDFLAVSTPQFAVISVGKNNYGHPSNNTLTRLLNSGVEDIFRTDQEGTILLKLESLEFFTGDFMYSDLNVTWQRVVFWGSLFLIGSASWIFIPSFKAKIVKKRKVKTISIKN